MMEPIEVVNEIIGSLRKSLKASNDANEEAYLAAWQKRNRRNGFNCWGPDEQEQRAMEDDCLKFAAKQEVYGAMLSMLQAEEQRIVREHLTLQRELHP